MKKIVFIIVLAAMLFMNTNLRNGFACSDFLLNNSGKSVVSARTMDFSIPLEADVVAVPRGEKFTSASSPTDKYMSWTSRYGFVGTSTFHKHAITDGLNEKGLSAGILWLSATKYPDISQTPIEKVILISDIVRWILGNFATVEEVKKGLKNVTIAGIHYEMLNNIILTQHIAIHDKNKKNIVIEVINGSIQVYDNPHHVLTNDPPFPDQIAALAKYEGMINTDGGMVGLPGDSSSPSRFARIFMLNHFVQQSRTDEEAINNARHLLNRVTLVDGESKGETTEYSVIRDHKNLIYYIIDHGNMDLRAIDIKKIDLSKNGERLAMPIATDTKIHQITNELKRY